MSTRVTIWRLNSQRVQLAGCSDRSIEVFKKATNMMIRDGDDYGNLGTAFAMMAAAYEKV